MKRIRERNVSIPFPSWSGTATDPNDVGSPWCATGINNGVRTPWNGTDHLPVANIGETTTDTRTHTKNTHRGKNKKMGGPNDQGMSSTWFHFELKILKRLTVHTQADLGAGAAGPHATNVGTQSSSSWGSSLMWFWKEYPCPASSWWWLSSTASRLLHRSLLLRSHCRTACRQAMIKTRNKHIKVRK